MQKYKGKASSVPLLEETQLALWCVIFQNFVCVYINVYVPVCIHKCKFIFITVGFYSTYCSAV